MKNRRHAKKSPLKRRPLPNPGDSVNDYLHDQLFDHVLPYFVFSLVALSLAIWEWARRYSTLPQNPWYITVFAILFTGYSAFRLWQIYPQLTAIRQGRDGEIAVGQFLDNLRIQGYSVFHDIPGEGFNIDHVILSPKGFFTVETKTFSKPSHGQPRIAPTEEGLVIDGGRPDSKPLNQAIAQSRWLCEFLKASTGKEWPIRPVLTFPGWFIERNRTRKFAEVWILEPKAIPKFLSYERDKVLESDVHLAASHLSRYIRSQLAAPTKR